MSYENINTDNKVVTFIKRGRQWSFLAGNGIMHKYVKDPNEVLVLEIEFEQDIPTGSILDETNSTITVVDETGADVSTTILKTDSKAVISDTKLRGIFNAGVALQDYVITFLAYTETTAYKYIGKILLQIREDTISAVS